MGTCHKTERKESGWAFWVTMTPHPPAWSRANSAPPPVLAFSLRSSLPVVEFSTCWADFTRACQAPSPLHAATGQAQHLPLTRGLGPYAAWPLIPPIAATGQAQHLPPGALCPGYPFSGSSAGSDQLALRCASRCERPPWGLVVLAFCLALRPAGTPQSRCHALSAFVRAGICPGPLTDRCSYTNPVP